MEQHCPLSSQEKLGALHCIWRTGVYKLFPFLLLYSTGFATLFPVIPTLVTNGFASQAAGHFVDCQLYTPATSPEECRNAHSQAVMWTSWTSFVSGSVLSFICAPFVGQLSDHWGRKPFMLIGVTLSLAPMITLMFFIWGWVPIQLYYPMYALNGMVSSFSTTLTAVADLLHQVHRATAIGYLSACFSVGILIGPVLGGYISTQSAVYVCITMIGSTLLYVALAVPETAPRVLARRALDRNPKDEDDLLTEPLLEVPPVTAAVCDVTQAAATQLGEMDFDPIPNVIPHMHEHTLLIKACGSNSSASSSGVDNSSDSLSASKDWPEKPGDLPFDDATAVAPGDGVSKCAKTGHGRKRCSRPALKRTWSDMLVGWRVIRGSPYYRKLVIIWVIVTMTWEGSQDLLIQYLQLQLGFNTLDQAHLLVMVAACGLTIKICALAHMVKVLGEQWMLVLGLAAYMLQDVLLANAPTKLLALLAIAAGSVSCVCWPASIALQTRHADPCDVGAVQGALSGISNLASGLGPVGFAALFSAFSRSDSDLPYFPQIVWYLAAALAFVAILLTCTLHLSEPTARNAGQDAAEHQAQSSNGKVQSAHPAATESVANV